jgi:hypothetical protein
VHLCKNKTLTYIKSTMVFGWWKKIKQGFAKAGQWIKNAAVNVYNKVLKPIASVVAPAVSKVATQLAPALGPKYGAIATGIAAGAETVQRVIQNPKDEIIPLLKNRR